MKQNRIMHGFTIIEMIVYGAILMSFLGVLTSLFSSLVETQLSSESQSAIVQDGRYIFSRISYDVGRASAITIPETLGGSGTVMQLSISGDGNTYSLINGNLVVTNSAGSYALNSFGTTVSGLTFHRLGNSDGKHSVQIGFTLSSTIMRTQGAEIRSFQTTFALR